MQKMVFQTHVINPNLYYIAIGFDLLGLVFYVDDFFLIGTNKLIVGCKENIANKFEMKDIKMMCYSWVWKFVKN